MWVFYLLNLITLIGFDAICKSSLTRQPNKNENNYCEKCKEFPKIEYQ